MSDPLRRVWDALESLNCQPHGHVYDFRSRCPVHDGTDPHSLHVSEGADGRALVFCFVCNATGEKLVEATDLRWSDLFPPGHRHAAPKPRGIAPPRRPLALVLVALSAAGIGYRATASPELFVAARCPVCGAGQDWPLWVWEYQHGKHAGRLNLVCLGGCEQHQVLNALTGRRP